ncbi:zinc finger CCCH domain-containing protein 67-like isoform X4 [Nicotiana tomentosiformis]|uniref:zinc finger CCCH domain-containing protein 67-like isoform X4 n=1 Tax=Nicotiana tomentosiformis TaxID=4098 RepID=UPI00087805D7
MEAIESQQHIQNLNDSTLEKQGLGLDPQPSFSPDPNVQNPPQNLPDAVESDDDDEIALQFICEELQGLVLNQAYIEERSQGENHEENGREKSENECGDNYYGGGDYTWSENGNENENDVENENSDVAGSKQWGFNGNRRGLNHPLRPDAADCAYYMKTGTCKYGLNCKFNHPSQRRNQYYLTEGGCKYGNACKYYHSRRKGAISPVLNINFLGLPIRPGEKDCPYYMRTGSCKYGSNCRFHHPDPSTVAGGDPSSGYNGGSAPVKSAPYPTGSSWSSPRALNGTASFVPVVYPASQGIPLSPQWNGYLAPVYPTSGKSLPTPPAFTMKDPAIKTNFYTRAQQPWLVEEYPERPSQPDCSYFIKTGDCKFHHPKNQTSKTNMSVLNDKGLPLRPDQAVCSFYSRYGICKFGPACKFDHPEHYDNSASSIGSVFDQRNSATSYGSSWRGKETEVAL